MTSACSVVSSALSRASSLPVTFTLPATMLAAPWASTTQSEPAWVRVVASACRVMSEALTETSVAPDKAMDAPVSTLSGPTLEMSTVVPECKVAAPLADNAAVVEASTTIPPPDDSWMSAVVVAAKDADSVRILPPATISILASERSSNAV